MNVQAKVALDKQKRPERFCPHQRCLWRTNGGYCPRHKSPCRTTAMEWIRNGCQLPVKVQS